MSGDQLRALQERFETALGNGLLEQGALTQVALEEAVNLQVVAGGHLSTSLWDLALCDDDTLAAHGAELLHVLKATPAELDNADPAVLRHVPRALAERLRVVPVRVEDRTLVVATCEPWNLDATEQVGFRAGLRVTQRYVTEVTLIRLLHQLYGVPLTARLRLGPQVKNRPSEESDTGEPTTWEVDGDLMTEESFEALYAEVQAAAVAAEEDEEDLPEIELLEEDEVVEAEGMLPITDLAEATALLDAAEDRAAVGRVMARFGLSRGERVALLVRQGRMWTGWAAAGVGLDPSVVRALMLPSEPGTMFGLVGDTGAHYLGPLAAHWVHSLFLRLLGDAKPRTVCLFPVHYRGRMVFGIYIDGGDGKFASTDIGEVLLLAQRVPAALDRLVKRRLAARA